MWSSVDTPTPVVPSLRSAVASSGVAAPEPGAGGPPVGRGFGLGFLFLFGGLFDGNDLGDLGTFGDDAVGEVFGEA